MGRARRDALALAGLLLVAAASFAPALDAGFVNLDDDQGVQGHAQHLVLSPAGLSWMFGSFALGHYQPLAWLSFAVDIALWGPSPAGFHLTNLLLHLLATALAFLLAREVLAPLPARGVEGEVAARTPTAHAATSPASAVRLGAVAAALVFAVHPLRVEVVAWITQRHTLVAAVFLFLAALLWARRARRSPQRAGVGDRGFWLVFGASVLSLLGTAWAATLPVVLLIADVWPLRRLRLRLRLRPARLTPPLLDGGTRAQAPPVRAVLLEKLVLSVPGLAALALAAAAQHGSGAARSWELHGLLARLAQAGYGLVFYPLRTLLPVDLAPLHPIGARLDPGEPRFLLAALAVLLLAALGLALRRRAPAVPAALLAYLALVAPVLGLLQSGPQLVAERYAYVPTLPLALLAGAGIAALARRPGGLLPARLLVAAWVAVFAPLTFAQTGVWRDSVTLWSRGVAVHPESYFAHTNLARALAGAGRPGDAIPHFEAALERLPADRAGRFVIWQDAAAAYAETGRFDEARALWRELLAHDPDHVDALFSLGLAAELEGDLGLALSFWERTLAACARRPAEDPAAPEPASCERARALLELHARR